MKYFVLIFNFINNNDFLRSNRPFFMSCILEVLNIERIKKMILNQESHKSQYFSFRIEQLIFISLILNKVT